MDNQWRARMRPDQGPKESSNPPSPSAAPAAPASRPKLNLTKRTVSEAVPSPTSGGDSKASPFGAARPIDTATREREVEEKRQLALRQKKDSDDKAAKTEKTEKPKKDGKEGRVPGTDSNKDAVEPPRGGGNFEILRRAGEDESGMNAEQDPEAAPAAEEAEKATEETNGQAEPTETTDDNDGWSTVGAKPRSNRRGQPTRGFA